MKWGLPQPIRVWLRGSFLLSSAIFMVILTIVIHIFYHGYLMRNITTTLSYVDQATAERWLNPGPATVRNFSMLHHKTPTMPTMVGRLPLRYVLIRNGMVLYDSAHPHVRRELIPPWLIRRVLTSHSGNMQLDSPTIHQNVDSAWTRISGHHEVVAVTLDLKGINSAVWRYTIEFSLTVGLLIVVLLGGIFSWLGRKLARDAYRLVEIHHGESLLTLMPRFFTTEATIVARRWASTLEVLETSRDTDGLTGAWNRRPLDHFFDQYDGDDALFILFDLNHFKTLNDAHGHQAGDQVLCDFVKALSPLATSPNLLCRMGGDEFVLVLTHTRWKDACSALLQTFPPNWSTYPVGVSAGVSVLPLEATSLDAAYQLADKRLYSLKREHKSAISTPFGLFSWSQDTNVSPTSPNNALSDNRMTYNS